MRINVDYIFYIDIYKLYHRQKFSLINLFEINKNSEIAICYTILTFCLAI